MLRIEILDYDATARDDFLGLVEIQLPPPLPDGGLLEGSYAITGAGGEEESRGSLTLWMGVPVSSDAALALPWTAHVFYSSAGRQGPSTEQAAGASWVFLRDGRPAETLSAQSGRREPSRRRPSRRSRCCAR